MKRIELYTVEDAEKDLEKGRMDSEIAVKKWERILKALEAIEEVTLQDTSFCMRYRSCEGCPLLKYDFPCGHPYSTYSLFYQELRKLKVLALKLYGVLKEIHKREIDDRRHYV